MPIVLQPLTDYEPNLAAIYLKWFNDPEIANRIAPFGGLPATPETCEAWMRQLAHSETERRFTILLKRDNYRPIGDCGLTYIDYFTYEAGVSIFIADRALRGQKLGQFALKGLIKYAFSELKLKQLYLTTDAEYAQAVNAYQAVGFKSITVAETYRNDGTIYQQLFMELVKTKEFTS
jgi:diamine N-acetyltransferase